MPENVFYVTTPIYYPSDKLHIGHALTTTMADTLARFHRLKGDEVWFLTGSDEHGQKIQRKAKENGTTPKDYVDGIVASFQELWRQLDISYDDFIRTTEARHQKVVQQIFRRIYENGDIYKSKYEGWYCTPCETFWTERQLDEGNCPDCGRSVELLQEESYFFRMSKYADRLLEYIELNPEFIQPQTRKNEMLSFIRGGLEDLCVSRTTFNWGIPVPIDEKHVIYVWFDALTNYVSALGYGSGDPKFAKFWPAVHHMVGKDIVRFHTVIWPIILMAAGIEPPKEVFGHGWLLVDGGKMSKSKGNVVDPMVLLDLYGSDAIRYFLLREMPCGSDGYYSEDALVNRINVDLANDLGNLVSRTTAMLEKFCQGVVPESADPSEQDAKLLAIAQGLPARYEKHLDQYEFSQAILAVWELVDASNKYIEDNAPWALAKDPQKAARLGTVLYNMAEAMRIITVFLGPIMPKFPTKVWEQLGLNGEGAAQTWESVQRWGGLPAGTRICRGEPLFPRIEWEEAEQSCRQYESSETEKVVKASTDSGEITIEEFSRVDLRLAEVLACERVPKADKLLRLTVRVGEEERTIVAGIAQHYQPEKMVGKKVVVVANLKPAKLRGITSQGMILAASQEGQLGLLTVEGNLPAGAKVK